MLAGVVFFLLFVGALSLAAGRGAGLARESATVLPAGFSTALGPRRAFVVGPLNVTRLSELVCVIYTNTAGVSVYALTPQEYEALMENHSLGGVALAWNATQVVEYGQVRFAPGTYYVALYDPDNWTVGVYVADACALRPVG